MNKRILHLFNKAGFHQPEMERQGLEDTFEKFAQLIVNECAGIYDSIDNGNLVNGTDDYLEALHKTFWSKK